MSKQGKAIALDKLKALSMMAMGGSAISATQIIRKYPGPVGAIMASTTIMSSRAMSQIQMQGLINTPHQYFNDAGKIDKRKARRHDRKRGVKVHTTRILRPMTKARMDKIGPIEINLRGDL